MYVDLLDGVVGDKLNAKIEENNPHNHYAVAVKVERGIVNLVPQEISKRHNRSSLLLQASVHLRFVWCP